MDEGKARVPGPKPQWWSRRRRNPDDWPLQEPSGAPAGPAAEDAPHPLSGPEPEPDESTAPGTGTAAAPEGTPHPLSAPVSGDATDVGPASRHPGQQPDSHAGTAPVPGDATDVAPAAASPSPHPVQPPEPHASTAPSTGTAALAAPDDAPHPRAAPVLDSGPVPLHAPDPYGTPPYGRPGPWAPAPPVQRPAVTPAHGMQLPPVAPVALPAYPQAQDRPQPEPQAYPYAGSAPAPRGPWAYDPWAAPAKGPQEGPAAALSRGRILAGAVAVALVAGGLGAGVGVYLERDGGVSPRVTLPQAAPGRTDRAPGSIAGIAARALPGVVTIHVRGGGEQGTGTGFVLDDKGHILTNNHVVQPAGSDGSISVTFNGGQTAKATLVGRDGGYDLAVIKVSGVSGLTPLPLGNSDSVRVGDSVVAIGAPFDLAGTVTTGIISAKQRPITAGGKKQDGSDISYVDALQTDAPINPGNSGGPLMDSAARVIGINSAIRSVGDSDAGGQGGSIGLGFAIPVNQAKRVAEELINTGRATHPVIGVSLDMGYAGDGARVNTDTSKGPAVVRGGPADKAGIQSKDVIKKVDGAPVHSGQELIVKIRSHRPGDTLGLTVERDGRERAVRLTLGSASTR
ncbi:trypsin-like peptidase domain-containing protein [Streptomyces sp. NPDC026206]|uniref:S1C family serine protease n=1 Tax=Streptomyces sp. NPDC026206 TaxID=3157089 RepID=UPI00340A278A